MAASDRPDQQGAEEPVERPLFDRDDEGLPWLESDEEEAERGIDTRRIAAFVAGAIALLALLVGLVWWLANRGPDPELVADGSIIKAPAEPYKTRPDDPGGMTFEGTGDASFVVGDGQTPEARLAGAAPPPVIPNPAATAAEQAADASADKAPAEPAIVKGVGVQVGAYSTREAAQAGWSTLVARHAVLQGTSHRIVEGRADIGTVYRLQVVKADVGSAEELCAALKADGGACQVKR